MLTLSRADSARAKNSTRLHRRVEHCFRCVFWHANRLFFVFSVSRGLGCRHLPPRKFRVVFRDRMLSYLQSPVSSVESTFVTCIVPVFFWNCFAGEVFCSGHFFRNFLNFFTVVSGSSKPDLACPSLMVASFFEGFYWMREPRIWLMGSIGCWVWRLTTVFHFRPAMIKRSFHFSNLSWHHLFEGKAFDSLAETEGNLDRDFIDFSLYSRVHFLALPDFKERQIILYGPLMKSVIGFATLGVLFC